ncbi:transglutaminaseTgpA domain-containing protein [Mycetocola sp. 2940]|uniref:transglutaminaseTgpA domain-containing protein n=1 Tax=Mycetocola sp. 2940 TaxID=3156452 RepID=UPI003397774B
MTKQAFTIPTTVLFAVVAIAVASSVWWPVYQTQQFVLVGVGAILLGTVVALVGWLFRLHGVVVIALTLLVYFVAGVALTMPDRVIAGILPQPEALLELVTGTATAWKELVTILVPVGTYQGLLIPAYCAILGTTVITVSLALRVKRGEIAVVWPIVLLILGIAFGRDESWFPLAIGLGLAAITLGWLIWLRGLRHRAQLQRHAAVVASVSPSRRERRRAGIVGAMSAALILAVATSGGAVLASVLVPDAPRNVIRSHIEQAFSPRDYPSPLSAFRRYLLPDVVGQPLLTVSGMPQDGRLRLATLDSYDGVVYSVGGPESPSASGTFVRVPYRVEQAARGERVSMTVVVDGYSGIWLPGAGHLAEIGFSGNNRDALTDSFYYNDVTGSSAVVRGLTTGDGYRMTSVVTPTPSMTELADIAPGTAELPPFDDVPAALTDRLDAYTEGIAAPGARLTAMLDGLKTDGYISHGIGPDEPNSRSGHGIDRIEELLTDSPMVGDAEQYAVTAALMARELGFPARVVVGFVPTETGATVTIAGGDISAWIEVQDSTGRWLTADPVPVVREIPEEEPEDPRKVSRPPAIVQPPLDEEDEEIDRVPPADSEQNEDIAVDPFLAALLAVARVAGGLLLVLAVLAAPFLTVIGAKRRRRTLRRRRTHPADRIRGGWQEFADSAVDYGLEAPPSATRREVAKAVGGKRAYALASVADRATFSRERPSHEDADRVWAAVDDLRGSLATGRTRWQRFRAASSLRSLRGRRR